MSTVLWANLLVDGKVECQSEDHFALCKHAEKLDSISKSLKLPSFLEICDTTDVRFNAEEFDLPEGVTSTNEVKATEGVWLPLAEAIVMLETLLLYITDNQVRFGILKNLHSHVVEELERVLSFARAGSSRAQEFNFCIVS